MGQQQLLLIILGVIIVGVAIAVGISQFGTNAVKSAKDAIASDMSNLAADAFQYKIKPTNLGGGNGKFTGYTAPKGFSDNANATYVPVVTDSQVIFTATSKAYPTSTVIETVFSNGTQGAPTYVGWTE